MKNACLALTLTLAVACNGKTATNGKQTVGAKGGTVSLNNGEAALVVPPGALDKDVVLSISESSASAPDGYTLGTKIYKLEPEGTTFTQPVTITLKTTGTANKFYWSQLGHTELFDELTPVAASDTVSATNTHFSLVFGGTHEANDNPNQCTQTVCGSDCVDLQTASAHCGSCDHACASNEVCGAGTCARPTRTVTLSVLAARPPPAIVHEAAAAVDFAFFADGTGAYTELTPLGTSTLDNNEYAFQVVEDSYRVIVGCKRDLDYQVHEFHKTISTLQLDVLCYSNDEGGITPYVNRNVQISGVVKGDAAQDFAASANSNTTIYCTVDAAGPALITGCFDEANSIAFLDEAHARAMLAPQETFDAAVFRELGSTLSITPIRNVPADDSTLTVDAAAFVDATERTFTLNFPVDQPVALDTSAEVYWVAAHNEVMIPNGGTFDAGSSSDFVRVMKVRTVADAALQGSERSRTTLFASTNNTNWQVAIPLPKNTALTGTITLPQPLTVTQSTTSSDGVYITAYEGLTKAGTTNVNAQLRVEISGPVRVAIPTYSWTFDIDAAANTPATYELAMHRETAITALSEYLPSENPGASGYILTTTESPASATAPAYTLTARRNFYVLSALSRDLQ